MSTPQPEQQTLFPWRDHNRFGLLLDGDAFYPAMLAAIAEARRHVLLEMYLIESGSVATRFIDAFCAAAARGVAVYLLLDDFGARGLRRQDRERLTTHGVRLAFFNRLRYGRLRRNFLRDHRKLLVIDGARAFVGGAGITDEFDPPGRPQQRWRETMVDIRGPVVADWQRLFAQTWRRYTRRTLPPLAEADAAAVGRQHGRVCYSRGLLHPEITYVAINRVRHAQRRVWLATAYFVPTVKFRRALRQAAARGVDVRLLLSGPHTDHPAVRHAGRRFYPRLLRHGVRIFEYQPRFNHSKVLLCDDWASIGSSNIDRWNLHWNLEANQEVDDVSFATEVMAVLAADLAESSECLLEQLERRPWYRRLPERFWGKVDLWLVRWVDGRAWKGDD